MTFSPPLEVPADLLTWMHTQSQSEFIGGMLRVIQRTGGLTEKQLQMVSDRTL